MRRALAPQAKGPLSVRQSRLSTARRWGEVTLAVGVVGVAALGVGFAFGFGERLAFAQSRSSEEAVGGRKRVVESPQNFAFELRFSPFTPDIDSDPALHGATPYKDIFGTHPRLLFAAEFDWQAYRIPYVGTIGPGVSAGYTSMSDPAPLVTPINGTTASGETTTLQIFPFYGAIVLRVDAAWREVHIPIVPYAKAGIGYALWRASNTLGTSTYGGVSGTGSSVGAHYAFGVSLNLNPFDMYAAREFDESLGVNNTYLFAEWGRDDLSGLGFQTHPLRVGGTGWTFGLALEF